MQHASGVVTASMCAQLASKPASAEPASAEGRLAPTRSCNVGAAAAAHGLLAGTQLSLSAEMAASAARNGARAAPLRLVMA